MTTNESRPRAAIIGAGPAGFYATDQLLDAGFDVDLIDLLPTPYGLVRSGVAPDHPKIKSVTRVYDKTAGREGFRFFGGVALGSDITRAELLERYHAVVYAFGTPDDNRLGIPGEDRPGSYPATRFVAWYNGHPDGEEEEFVLSARRAVVIGNGNVAVDVARMLVLEPGELAVTDTADHAIPKLAEAKIEEVVLLGRRGPAQAAFTNPELRELGELTRADIDVDPAEVELDGLSQSVARGVRRRDLQAQRGAAARLRAALTDGQDPPRLAEVPPLSRRDPGRGRARAGHGRQGRAQPDRARRSRAVCARSPPSETEEIECGLVLRSIGYRGRPSTSVPFDHRRGPDPKRRRTGLRRGGAPPPWRVRRRLDQARPQRA